MGTVILIILVLAIGAAVYFIFFKGSSTEITMNGATFERFRIHRLIKRGGMATVHSATDLLTGKQVALKIIHDEFLTDQDLISKFLTEGQILEQLQEKYPAAPIVKVHRYSKGGILSNTKPFIALELINAEDLDSLLSKRKFSLSEIIFIVSEIARGLECAHNEGVWHRDVSPGNIMVGLDGGKISFVKIIDFGVARHEYLSKHTPDGSIHGKPPFMSPELCNSMKIDGRSDIYALGVLFYTLLSGHTPFESRNPLDIMEMHRSKPVPPLPESISADIAAVVYKMLEKDRNLRYQSMNDIIFALQEYQSVQFQESGASEYAGPYNADNNSEKNTYTGSGSSYEYTTANSGTGGSDNVEPPVKDETAEISGSGNAGKVSIFNEKNIKIAIAVLLFVLGIALGISILGKKTVTADIPILSVSEQMVNFPQIDLNASEAREITIKNNGSGELLVKELKIEGEDRGYFEIGNVNFPIIIEKNQQRTISVIFRPGNPGDRKAELQIISNDRNIAVALSGSAGTAESEISTSETYLNFAEAEVSSKSIRRFKIENKSQNALNISNISISGLNREDFNITPLNFPLILAGLHNQEISVAFQPKGEGERKAVLEVVYNDKSVRLPLYGSVKKTGEAGEKGGTAELTISESSLNFSETDVYEASEKELTIENKVSAVLELTEGSIAGANREDFQITNFKTPLKLSKGQKKTFIIRFTPSREGNRSGTLHLTYNNKGAEIFLSGRGTAAGGSETGEIMEKGIQAYDQGNYSQAENLMTQAINNERNNAAAYYTRGLCRFSKNLYLDAANDFAQAVKYLIYLAPNRRMDIQCKAQYFTALSFTQLYKSAQSVQDRDRYKVKARNKWEDFTNDCNLGGEYSSNAKLYLEMLK